MAVSSTIATAHLSPRIISLPVQKIGSIFPNSIKFVLKPRRLSIINSTDVPTEATATTTTTDADPETSIEAPQGSAASLITALNVERALRGIPITDVDHYGRLGLKRGCTYEQVTVAYRNKVEIIKNEELGQEEVSSKLELLKESYSILSSEQERRLYDWSLARSEGPDKYVSPFEVEKAKPWLESPPPQEAEDVRPTRLVGYFLLGWFVLSCIVSIALSR
uniref:Chaperone DnaJ-domain superfamily protein n=1 Tax=Melianthus villosus TaxID=377280 RepID=A0A0F7H007_9ROSI